MMERVVQPELLDELPARDPLAARSRRDLQRLNLLMGHHRIMAKALSQAISGRSPHSLAELGAGGGELLLHVARRLNGRWPHVEVTLVDRADVFDSQTRGEFGALGWSTNVEVQDALSWLRHSQAGKCDVIVTNLFLHQCPDQDLAEMFRLAVNSAKILIAVEPRRGFLALLCSRFVGLVGCGAVTCYDAPVSVRAGFSGRELSALWPDQKNWELSERRAGLFSHLFIARRKR
jgi:hypothetical protein